MAAELTPEMQGTLARRPRSMEDEEEEEEEETPATDIHNVGVKLQRAKEVYEVNGGFEDKPSKGEVLGWFFYGLCSYFIHTVLIPIVFPLMISQAISKPIPEPAQGWEESFKGFHCNKKEMQLFQGLTYSSINIGNLKFSPLEWTSISWFIGMIVAAPVLGSISIHLDYRPNSHIIAGAATALGAIFCLPTGFFKTIWIFPLYIAAIVAANTVGAAFHSRHLGLMIRGFLGTTIKKDQFPDRRAVASWLSLYATASGTIGSAIMSSFAYHMLKETDGFISLWIVIIFSGLKWIAGTGHIITSTRSSGNTLSATDIIPKKHLLSIFKYPHAAGSLSGVFLSSFSSMCLFTGGVLYLVGELCIPEKNVLYVWLTYFIFPLFSLPLLQVVQYHIRADAVKMQLLGFLLSTFTSGMGFYYRKDNWHMYHVIIVAGIQGTATGVLHAFGRVLLVDCAPLGKEGAFSVWFSWVRMFGTCVGFTVAAGGAGNINRSFGVAFITGIVGIVILIFGNISNFRGAMAAGHLREHSEMGSPAHGLDSAIYMKGEQKSETPKDISIEV